MQKLGFIALVVAGICAASCSNEDEWEPDWNSGNNGGGSSTSVTASIGDLTSFSIAIDSTSLSESETIPSDDEDYVENNTFNSVISIDYNGSEATVTGDVEGVSVACDGAHVVVTSTVKGVRYVLSGTTSNGSFKIYSEKKYALELNGVSITNPTGAAINSQSKKRAYVILDSGTMNRLADGESYTTVDDEDMKGVFFSEGELLFSGSGKLRVYSSGKHGIVSDDYVLFRPGGNIYVNSSSGHCVKANDAIYVRGGVINLETSANGAKGLNCDSVVVIDGGRITALTTGDAIWDTDDSELKGPAGIKSDYGFTMNGGEVYAKSSGKGGKGISSDDVMTFNDGTVRIITTGTKYTYGNDSKSPKGIRGDNDIVINGGSIKVRTTGGENSEGIESKATLTVNGGTTEVYAYDDAINAKTSIVINGGSVFTYAEHDDGVDSNGTLTIAGGTVVACGTTSPEDGFDCDNSTFKITGGTILGIGGGSTSPSSSVTTQPVALLGASGLNASTYIALADNDGKNVYAFKVPRSYNSCTLLLSSPSLKKGGKCTVSTGVSVTGGTDFDGLVTNSTISGGTTLASLTFNNYIATYNYSSGMGGGPGW